MKVNNLTSGGKYAVQHVSIKNVVHWHYSTDAKQNKNLQTNAAQPPDPLSQRLTQLQIR
jgi:hypothetical protein